MKGRLTRPTRPALVVLLTLALFLVVVAAAGSYTSSSSTISTSDGSMFSGQVLEVSNVICPDGDTNEDWRATATIDWGDGTAASGGTIAYPNPSPGGGTGSSFTVSGTHTYAQPGTFTGTVHFTIVCPLSGSNPTGSANFTADVADNPPFATAHSFSVLAGAPYTVRVATFADANADAPASSYSATIDWGDGSPSSAGTVTANPDGGADRFAVDGTHEYATAGTYTLTVTIEDADGAEAVVSPTATVSNPPSSVAFSFSPDTDPLLSRQLVTFVITNPTGGVTYQWDFGDKDSPTGSTSAPFVVQAEGATVHYAYPDPPKPPANPNAACASPVGCNGSFGVYTVRVRALIPNQATLNAMPQNVVVVPVKRPTASFRVLRTSVAHGGKAASTSVTHPITIVPQASLPDAYSGVQDEIVREDYWFNLGPGQAPTGPPDLTCIPAGQYSGGAGTCGHYTGTALNPGLFSFTQEPGQHDIGTGPITLAPAAYVCPVNHKVPCHPTPPVTVSPTANFESFSMNFWDNALANIGSPGGIPTLPLEQSCAGQSSSCGQAIGYPPLASVNLDDVDGYQGEQVPTQDGVCFPGYPANMFAYYDGCKNPQFDSSDNAVQFGPYDLSHYGANSRYQLEDQWNFLYNYATVVGTDTNLNAQFGPATGSSEETNKGTVPRTITMVAYDSEGVASAPATQNVPLTPGTNPTLELCIKIPGSQCVKPGNKVPPFAGQISAGCDKAPAPCSATSAASGTTLQIDTTGSSGGDDPILYYAVAVGQPNKTTSVCTVGKLGGFSTSGGTTGTAPVTPKPPPNGPTKVHPFALRRAKAAAVTPGSFTGTGSLHLHIITPPTAQILTPFGMPVFSDLLAGAFPYHDCGSFAIRTVDANATPAQPPTTGPNVPAKASIRRAGKLRRHATFGSGALGSTVANSLTNPAEITADPNGLKVQFAQAGEYSIAVAAYDSSGLGAITRIDGFVAQPPATAGLCQTVNSEQVMIEDGKMHDNPEPLVFSGQCMTQVVNDTHTAKVWVSSTPVDFDGAPLIPQPGHELVIDTQDTMPANSAWIYVTNGNCQIPSGDLTLKDPATALNQPNCRPPSPTSKNAAAGSLYVAIGGGQNSNPPGIAELNDFNTHAADWYLGPSVNGDLPPADNESAKHAVQDCGLYGGSQPWNLPSGAQYEGFDVATHPCMTFTKTGQSRIAFWDSLPSGFTNGSKMPATSQVVLQGSDSPTVVALSTNQYANVARVPHAHLVIAGSPASFPRARRERGRAHTADLGTPGFPSLPSCPPQQIGKSGLTIPDSTDLGPLSLPDGAQFCYVQSTGDFVGNVKVNVPGPLPLNGVQVGFEIGHGRLIDAGGEISGNVPVGPLFINDLKFDIQTNPVEVAGAIEASILDVVDVEAQVIVNSSPPTPYVDFSGSVGLFGFQFGDFSMYWTHNSFGMALSIDENFGPASLNLSVKGAMIFSPHFEFYALGQGSACLFICLDVQGLVSNDAAAACGSINLVFVTLSAGVAVVWSGPDGGVHLFTGCNLTPYIPQALVGVQTSRDGPAARATQATSIPAGGTPQPLVLHRKGDCTPTVQTHCAKSVATVQVHSLLSTEAVGQTPIVTLTGPGGTSDSRVIQTPGTPGYYGFESFATPSGGTAGGETDEGTSLVAQDPVPTYDNNPMSPAYCSTPATPKSCQRVTTTTLFVADPGPGTWTLTVDSGSPAVIDVAISHSQRPVSSKQFNGAVHVAKLKLAGKGFVIKTDGLTFASKLLQNSNDFRLAPSVEIAPFSRTALSHLRHQSANDLDVPVVDESRLRAVLLKVPASFQGTVTVIDHGPTVDQVLASHISSKNIPAHGLPILFEPTPDFRAKHEIEAFLSDSDGMPARMIVLSKFVSPPLPKPQTPKILKIVRKGTSVVVYFDPRNDPVSQGIGLALATGGGQSFEDTFPASQLHPVGRLTGIGAAKQAGEYRVTIKDVDPTDKIKVGLDGFNDGRLSGTAEKSMGPAIPSTKVLTLFSAEHIHL